MGPCFLSPFGIQLSCMLAAPPSAHLHTCDDCGEFGAESYGRRMVYPGNESDGEASSLCPISVAHISLAAPGRNSGLVCPPRGPSPLVFPPRCPVSDLKPEMGLGVQRLPPSPGGTVHCVRLSCTAVADYRSVCCLPPAN